MKAINRNNSKTTNFYIHYELNEGEIIDLNSLGKSIIGFNSLLKEAFKISKIDGEIEILTAQPKEGSIIIPILFDLALNHSDLLFGNVDAFLDFLKVSSLDLYNHANQYIQDVGYSTENEIKFWTQEFLTGNTTFQKGFNNFADKRPGEFWLYTSILVSFLIYIIRKVKGLKNNNIPDNETPKNYFSKIKKLGKRFKGPLFPLKNGDVKEIGFSTTGKKEDIDENTRITPKNMGDYLPDSEVILEKYKNGNDYDFKGEIKNFQSSRGDFLKIKVETEEGNKLLVCKPWEGHTTEEFIQFYKKKVVFRAEVLRDSIFQIPRLKIVPQSMQEQQKPIFTE